MQTRITVNGVEYRSVDEMPADVRRQYEQAMSMLADRDRNGVPDILEGRSQLPAGARPKTTEVVTSVSNVFEIDIDGKRYTRLEDVPRELRDVIDRACAAGNPQTTIVESRTTPRTVVFSDNSVRRDGITIRITWPVVFAVLTVAGLAALVYSIAR
jgi:hypothetical protein